MSDVFGDLHHRGEGAWSVEYNTAVQPPEVTRQLDAFFSQHQALSFKTDDTILSAGDRVEMVYYLKSGIVRQSTTSQQGQEVTITFYKPGAFFPLIWAVKDTPVLYDFRAVTNGYGWKAPKSEVITFLQSANSVLFDLSLRLLSGLEGLSRKVEFALQTTAYLRTAEALLTLAYRFGNGARENVKLDFTLTHQELAEITGLTRETVSRELKVLRDEGVIVTQNHQFMVPSLDKLEAIVNATDTSF